MQDLLEKLSRPRTTQQLAEELSAPKETLEPMLALLAARGYVGQAYSQSPTCGTGCGSCSLKNLCPAQGEEAPFLNVWRVTEKGLDAMELARR